MVPVAKLMYIFILCFLLIYMFGWESMTQFIAGDYNMVTKIIDSDGEDVPAPLLHKWGRYLYMHNSTSTFFQRLRNAYMKIKTSRV